MKKLAITLATLLAFTTLSIAQGPTTNFQTIPLNTDPVPVQSGEDAEITFKMKNRGDTEAENVEVELMDSFPFKLKPDEKRNYRLGTVTPGEEYYITADVLVDEEASDGNNSLKARVIHGDFSIIKEIPVKVRSDDIELNLANLETSPSDLKPDTENNQLNLEIVNNGEKTAESVTVELSFPNEFEQRSSLSTRKALGNLNPGEKKQASFDFDIVENASKGEKQISASITYSRDDDTRGITQEENFSVYLSGKPQYEVVSVEEDLQAGKTGEIEVTVRNYGSEKSESTRVRVLDNSDLPFEFDSANRFLGTLEPGSTGTVIFEPEIESGAQAKEYLLDFEIKGVKDSEVFVDQKVTGLEVREAEQQSSILPLIGVVGAIILVGLYLAKRRGLVSSLTESEQNSTD